MESRKIYNRISVLRIERNISRKDLAEIIGVNFQTIGYLEREEYNPSLDLAFKISEFFNLPIELIFSPNPLKPLSQEFIELKNKNYRRIKNENPKLNKTKQDLDNY
jgi:DNA-binding XRE family transcriptional regulator